MPISAVSRGFSSCRIRRCTRTFWGEVCPQTPPPPPSSSASAPIIVLRPRPSRLLLVWWLALHGLLAAAALLVAGPAWMRAAAAGLVLIHCVARRPAATPSPIYVAADARCWVPALGGGWLVPGPRTRLADAWILLSLQGATGRRDILLCADQVDSGSFARLMARLRRRPAAGTRDGSDAQKTRSGGSALES